MQVSLQLDECALLQVWGTLLVVPYLLTRGVLPIVSCGLLTAEQQQAAFLWGWLVETGLLAGYLMSIHEQRIIAALQSTLHVDKNLVRHELPSHPGSSGGHTQRGNVRSVSVPGDEKPSAAMEMVMEELRMRLHAKADKVAHVRALLTDR